jgi:hypothetical protein
MGTKIEGGIAFFIFISWHCLCSAFLALEVLQNLFLAHLV